jgi:hypothetical protein
MKSPKTFSQVRIMRSLFLLWSLVVVCVSAQAQNLIHNGDFEAASPQSPPPGWTMWGAEQWKIPQNYRQDIENAHAGKASLRIHHPANTHGYIVATPKENIITVQKGRSYSFSFWAKSERPGNAFFQIQGFSRLAPMESSGSLLDQPLEVTPQWRQFTFRRTESLDFLAEDHAYMMLAFSAAPPGAAEEERTLWIDDVVVETAPAAPDDIKLQSLKTIPYAAVNHRLQPGDSLQLTIDATRKVRHVTREAGGVSFHRVNGYMNLPYNRQGEYKFTPQQEAAIHKMRLPWTRFYGLGAEPFSLESALDKAAHVLQQTGIPQESSVLEFEDQGAQRELPPETWVRGVEYSLKQGYKFQHWEISNEPWIHRSGAPVAFATPQDYVAHVKAVAPAIKRVQPQSQIGIGIHQSDLGWGNYVLRASAGQYDFVAAHWYSFIDVSKSPFEDIVAGENYRILDQMQRLNALLRAYNPGRDIYQYDTEWSLHSGANGGANNTIQNGNIVGVLHRAVRLIYYMREEIVRGASAWEMFSSAGQWNALGVLPPDGEKRSMLYWMHRTFNEHTGEWVLDMQGTTPYYQPQPSGVHPPLPGPLAPAVAMLDKDGKTIYVIAANASWSRAIPCEIDVRNFDVTSASGLLLSHSDVKGQPLLEKKEDFVADFPLQRDAAKLTCTLPPHSVAFITMRK